MEASSQAQQEPPLLDASTSAPARRRAPSVSSPSHQPLQLPPFDLDSLTVASRHGPTAAELHLATPQTLPVSSLDTHPLRRKPLPQTASPAVERFSPAHELDDAASVDLDDTVSSDHYTRPASTDPHDPVDSTTGQNPIIIATDTAATPSFLLDDRER